MPPPILAALPPNGLLLLAGAAHAEQWADESAPAPPIAEEEGPRIGPVVGLHIGANLNVGPELGSRAGVRIRWGRHTALSLFFDYQLAQFEAPVPVSPFQPSEASPLLGHFFRGVARLELISASASPRVLIPGLTAGLFVGAGAGVLSGEVFPSFVAGLHLALTRLEPTQLWFPVFFDLGMGGGTIGLPGWRFVFGVGL